MISLLPIYLFSPFAKDGTAATQAGRIKRKTIMPTKYFSLATNPNRNDELSWDEELASAPACLPLPFRSVGKAIHASVSNRKPHNIRSQFFAIKKATYVLRLLKTTLIITRCFAL